MHTGITLAQPYPTLTHTPSTLPPYTQKTQPSPYPCNTNPQILPKNMHTTLTYPTHECHHTIDKMNQRQRMNTTLQDTPPPTHDPNPKNAPPYPQLRSTHDTLTIYTHTTHAYRAILYPRNMRNHPNQPAAPTQSTDST